jgi:hypothetical protein
MLYRTWAVFFNSTNVDLFPVEVDCCFVQLPGDSFFICANSLSLNSGNELSTGKIVSAGATWLQVPGVISTLGSK